MSKRLKIILGAVLLVLIVGYFALRPGIFGPQVYLSGQKALVRVEQGVPGNTVQAIETTLCFWTTSMKAAALAAKPIEKASGQGYISGPGHISLASDGFRDQLKFNKATDFGILAQPIREVDNNAGRKYPVRHPKTGQAVIWLSDGLNSQAKKYDIEIKEVAGDRVIFTMPEGRKLTYVDSGSPIVQNNAFVGAAQVPYYKSEGETTCGGISARVVYRKLVKVEDKSLKSMIR
ncbi:MAG: hypothetical protein JL50_04070 [Peptococcaceae bacterium BICA1-7]|nr:MAG: hypothetical protein JL50_04070 [Peptococcaceae bacterium BICA1-7]HBV97560.1 hypothetical protein [Desulfotomaculum sp.]